MGYRYSRVIALLASVAAAMITVTSEAAPFPDSGSIYREYRDDSLRRIGQPRQQPQISVPAVSEPIESGHQVQVHGFRIVGNSVLEQPEIEQLLKPAMGQSLSTSELHQLADELMSLYRDHGFFAAKVFIPPQSIEGGIVELHIYEGYFEQSGLLLRNTGERVNSDVVAAVLRDNLQPGELIKTADVERSILLIDDLPGISSHATIYPGESVGAAHFLLETEDQPLFSGNVDYDNFGSYYTGQDRIGSTLYLNSPSKVGDQLIGRFVTSGSDSNYAYLNYTRPVGSSGLRLGASADYMDYQLGKQYRQAGWEGDAMDARLFATYPVIRSRHFNVIAEVDYSHSQFHDRDNSGERSDRLVRSGIFKISGDHDDDLLASGVTYFDSSLTLGSVDLDGNDIYQDFDQLTAKSQGSFSKFNLGLSRLQNLGGSWSTYASLNAQWADSNLDSSQKLFIGGPFSLPGYPVGEASGDSGAQAHIDLRYDFSQLPWGGDLQVSASYSAGRVTLHKDTWDNWQAGNSIIDNEYSLQSTGLGFTQSWGNGVVVRAMSGWQVGGNKGRNPVTDEASDNSDSAYRLWLQTIFYF